MHQVGLTIENNNTMFKHNNFRSPHPFFFKQDIPIVWEYAINKAYKEDV